MGIRVVVWSDGVNRSVRAHGETLMLVREISVRIGIYCFNSVHIGQADERTVVGRSCPV